MLRNRINPSLAVCERNVAIVLIRCVCGTVVIVCYYVLRSQTIGFANHVIYILEVPCGSFIFREFLLR